MKRILPLFLVVLLLVGCAAPKKEHKALTEDLAGNPITAPEKIERAIVLAPSIAEMLEDLGEKERIIAVDPYAQDLGLGKGLPTFDMMKPDVEGILAMKPDVVLITGMTSAKGQDPYAPLRDAGVPVVVIPTAEKMEDIETSLTFLGDLFGEEEKAEEMRSAFHDKVEAFRKKSASVAEEDRPRVYFEIAAAPKMYSFGKGTFLDEMVNLVGGKNVLEETQGWTAVNEESLVASNPQVIVTTVDYVENPVEEILGRPTFASMDAVKNQRVYKLKDPHFNLPTPRSVEAMEELGHLISPDLF